MTVQKWLDPRLKMLYVLLVGIGVCFISHGTVLLALLGMQLGLWWYCHLPGKALLAVVRRLAVVVGFIVLTYAIFGETADDRIIDIQIGGWLHLPLNLTGIAVGLVRSSRIVTIILASQLVQRTSHPAALIQGMQGLGCPAFLAYSLDMMLTALGPREPGSGSGRGRGGGKGHRQADPEAPTGLGWKRLLRGDLGGLHTLITQHLTDMRSRVAAYPMPAVLRDDLAIIVALAVVAMSLRFIRLLPGIPIAHGHKGAVLIPLYILAATLPTSRWGATRFGLLIGITGFLMGMGKFGPFEICRYLATGLFVDLAFPLLSRVFRTHQLPLYMTVGVGAAIAQVSTHALVAAVVQVHPAFFAMLVPMVISHVIFGWVSAFVTLALVKAMDQWRLTSRPGEPSEPLATSRQEASPQVNDS